MSDLAPLILAGLIGMFLGLFYFGGLWLTVRQLPTTQSPVILTLGSLVVRMAVTLGGFYLVMMGWPAAGINPAARWQRLLACLVGFVVMRVIVVSRLRPQPEQGEQP
jgi:F1F0 ATPase subunit 2